MSNRLFLANNGMNRVVLYGFHPIKDFVLIGSGIEDDCRFVPYKWFIENYKEIK